MHIRQLIIGLLMSLSLSAAAEFVTIELAYEVALSDLNTPVTKSGSLVFKECEDCDTRVIRMTRNTQFIVNGRAVELKEFRKQVFQVHDRKHVPVTVKHHLESDTVVSVSVYL